MYIHFECAGSVRLVVAATRMLDSRPPGESMEHPLTTHSPSVSAYPVATPLAYLSCSSHSFSLHVMNFVSFIIPSFYLFLYFHLSFCPSVLSSLFLSLCIFISLSVNLSPSFISPYFSLALVCHLRFRPHPETLIMDFSLFKEPQSPLLFSLRPLPLSLCLAPACYFHPSLFTCLSLTRLMRVVDSSLLSCCLRNVSLNSVATTSLVSLLCKR